MEEDEVEHLRSQAAAGAASAGAGELRQWLLGKEASLVAQMVKNLSAKWWDPGLIPDLGRSPGEGNGNLLHLLAWRIPWTDEPGGLQSTGLQRLWDGFSLEGGACGARWVLLLAELSLLRAANPGGHTPSNSHGTAMVLL